MKEILRISTDRDQSLKGPAAFISLFIIIISFITTLGTIKQPGLERPTYGLEDITSANSPEIEQAISSLSGWFIENQGQIENSDVKYVYSASDISIGFVESGYLITLTNEENLTSVVEITFGGANRVVPGGRGMMSQKSNYFIGNNSSNWKREVPNFKKVVYENLYDGIDLIYYCNEEGLKYDFIVNPGADPKIISMIYKGINDLSINTNGSIVIKTQSGELTDGAPYSYQKLSGRDIKVESKYLLEDKEVRINIENYDHSEKLIIDPILYSTYIGGSGKDDARTLTIDSDNCIYVASHTHSIDFPTTTGCFNESNNGSVDTAIYKFNSDFSSLIYSTYIGGSRADRVRGLCVDSEGCTYITGWVYSDDYPTTSGCYDDTFDGDCDGVVVKLSEDGTDLIYSTYMGGSDNDRTRGITVDSNNYAYVTGSTDSSDFPTTSGCYKEYHDGEYSQCFVLKMNFDGSDLSYSTFLGGTQSSGWDIDIDDEKNIYVVGQTFSPDFPTTTGCFDNTFNGNIDGFICKMRLDSRGTSDLKYGSFFGGTGIEVIGDMIIDDLNDVYITGATDSNDFPTSPGCYDPIYNGGYWDTFVIKLNPDSRGPLDLVYSTYIGGLLLDWGHGISIDSNNNACIVGHTFSPDFPTTPGCYNETGTTNSFEPFYEKQNPFVCKINSNGRQLLYSSYLTGEATEGEGWGIVVDDNDFAYITGHTNFDFPVTPKCIDNTIDGRDLFFVKMELTARNLKPEVYDITPSNYTYVSETVIISGNGWDPNNPKRIQFVEISINSGQWMLINGTVNWDYQWDTTNVEDGEYTLRIRAFDGEYYSETQEVILNVQNGFDYSIIILVIGIGCATLLIYLIFSSENVKFNIYLSIPLYSKLKKNKILDQSNRKDIYQIIVTNPGVSLSIIFENLEMGYGTLVHHLNILEKNQYIVSKKKMGIKTFFLRDSNTSISNNIGEYHISPIQKEILEYINGNGSVSRKEIEYDLNIKPRTLSYCLKRLREWGLIQRIGENKKVVYLPVNDD